MTTNPEPDQIPAHWDDHVCVYETVFEPFSLALTAPAFEVLGITDGTSVIDVAAGTGGAALALARRGAAVVAIDASSAMVERTEARAAAAGLSVTARMMDARHLDFPDHTFDAALSAFGIILVADAVGALAEMQRVVRPGGPVAIVTWTEPQSYELATQLGAAIAEVWPDRPASPLPAQLRFRNADALTALFGRAGLPDPRIETVEAKLEAPSVGWLAERLAFAPGMAALLNGLADRRPAILEAFTRLVARNFGPGPIALGGKAFVAVSWKT